MRKERKMSLRFTKLSCKRCGGTRLAKAPCPECHASPAPHESQFDVDRRATLVGNFHKNRKQVAPRNFPESPSADSETAFNRTFSALHHAAKDPRSANDLIEAFELLDQFAA